MNIYDEVTKLSRSHRLALCGWILRGLNLGSEDKCRLLGRVPRIDHSEPTPSPSDIEQALVERLNKQRRPEAKPWIARDARRHTRISKDAIA